MTTIQLIKRFFAPIKNHKGKMVILIGIFALRSVYYMAGVIFARWITAAIQAKDAALVMKYVRIFAARILAYQVVNFLRVLSRQGQVNYFVHMELIKTYIKDFLLFDPNETEKMGTGRTISIVEKGLITRSNLIVTILRKLTEVICALIFSGYLIYYISPTYFFVFLGAIIIFNILFKVLKGKAAFWRNQRNDKDREVTKNLVKVIMSKFEILVSGKGKKEIGDLVTMIDQSRYLDYRKHIYEHLNYNAPEIVFTAFRLGLYTIVGLSVINGKSDFAQFVMIVAALGYLDSTVTKIGTLYSEIIKQFGDVEKLRDFFDKTPRMKGFDTGQTFNHKHGNISFDNISYAYSPDKPVFHNFNLSIIGGKKTALVGPSGGGKSTLIKLIAGYIRPDEGNIIIDGQSLSETSLKSYYKHIGYLTQEPSVFDGTIRENLMYGISDSSSRAGPGISKTTGRDTQISGQARDNKVFQTRDDTLAKIISLSRCEWIHDLPHGLDTEIGEKGVRLSGGQRQRLAIAKIMLKNPDIILLDEPTSALDSENEELVTQALDNLFKNKTVIVVAHRLQTVKHADQILFIDRPNNQKEIENDGDGEDAQHETSYVAEMGTHEELIAKKGKYYKMVELQSGF